MIIVALLLLGLCFGSFVNAVVWRVHEQAKPKKQQKTSSKNLSILTGRSMCPNCKHILATKDLIPVLSWLQLRGKCRYCHKKFDDTPITELVLPALFILSYAYWPLVWDDKGIMIFVFWLVLLVGLLAMIIYDARWLLLPDRITYPMFSLVITQMLIVAVFFDGGMETVKRGLAGALIGGGIFYLIFQVSKGKWIGGGDVKLGTVLGLIVGGPASALLMLFVASCLGSATAIPLLITGRATSKTRLPFGPFLIASTIIVYLFGAGLITWYKRQIVMY